MLSALYYLLLVLLCTLFMILSALALVVCYPVSYTHLTLPTIA